MGKLLLCRKKTMGKMGEVFTGRRKLFCPNNVRDGAKRSKQERDIAKNEIGGPTQYPSEVVKIRPISCEFVLFSGK